MALVEELTARVRSLLRVKEFTDELETADCVPRTLGLIVEGRDPEYRGALRTRLSVRAADLGRHLVVVMENSDSCAEAGAWHPHDLGKIAVPDAILKRYRDLRRRSGSSCNNIR